MHKLRSNLYLIPSLFQISRLAWSAHPRAFAGIILVTIMQGSLPLVSVWVTKLLFDILARSLSSGIKNGFPNECVFMGVYDKENDEFSITRGAHVLKEGDIVFLLSKSQHIKVAGDFLTKKSK